MPGLRLVIHQRRQFPARPFARVAQIDVEGAGPGAVERRNLVVAPRRAGLEVVRYAPDLDRRLRQDAEVLWQVRLQRLDEAVAIIEDLLPALIGVGEQILRVLGERLS